MWNPDEKNKPRPQYAEKPLIPTGPLVTLEDYEVFKYNFLNSSPTRTNYGFEKNNGKLILRDRTWIDSTCDKQKVEWLRRIYKDFNGIGMENEEG